MTNRMVRLILEDRAGQWPIAVDWIASLRPFRFEHEGRTFDAAGQTSDGTWIYRTQQDAPPVAKEHARFERGEARCYVGEQWLTVPLPETVTFGGQTYRYKARADGRPVYWHG